MSKKKQHKEEYDDEFFVQLDFLRSDYDKSQTVIEEQKKDILRLIALVIEHNVPIPKDLLERYVRQSTDDKEELPFD